MLITAWVGMYIASPVCIMWGRCFYATLGISLMAGAAAILNHVFDKNLDLHMLRTANRPIPRGRIKPAHALLLSGVLAGLGWLILFNKVNALTCILTFASLIGYAGIYTLYLKHATPQNIVIGGLSGAMPPLLGWCAIRDEAGPIGWLLVLIIFVWTPPHFWALAIARVKDYAAVKIPMLPVTHGIKFTKLALLLYTCLLAGITSLPFVTGLVGIRYLLVISVLNAIFLIYSVRLFIAHTHEHVLALKTFKYSIWYLFLLFVTLMVDYNA